MKYLLTLVLGFMIGAGIALAGVYFNPLTRTTHPVLATGDSVFTYTSPVTSELAFTHGGLSRLPSYPTGVPDLWEGTINKSALSVLFLRDATGTSDGIASRVSYPSEDSDLLRRGALLTDDWLVSIPGQGSFFIDAESNWWPFLREGLIPVWYFGQPWLGPAVYEPTSGPGDDGRAVARGASGVFATRAGTAVERYQIEEFDDRIGPRQAYAELHWRLTDPAQLEAAQ